jgi:hypothetical protein
MLAGDCFIGCPPNLAQCSGYSGWVSTAVLTLIGKPGCHLCDAARDVVTSVVSELEGVASAPSISMKELSIFDDSELLERYAEEIPVLLLNGRVHNIWRVDADRLRAALLEV